MAAGATRVGVAAHPAVVGALVVLVLNDRVLKAWSVDHGTLARTVTGKASDLAGVLLLAVVVGLVTGRRRPAVLLVGLGFTALKLSPAVADLAVPILGGRTRTDPWDLLALVALVPADRLLRRIDGIGAIAVRPAWASLRATLGLAVVVLSVPAMTATSCGEEDHPGGLDTVVVRDDGTLAAALTYHDRRYDDDAEEWERDRRPDTQERVRGDAEVEWYLSADGGRTWRPGEIDRAETTRLLDRPRQTEACIGTDCFRPLDPTRIEVTTPTGTREISTLSDDTRVALDADREEDGCSSNPYVLGTEIAAVDGGAVATAGLYGVTRIGPAGAWESVPVGPMEPPRDLPSAWPRHLRGAPYVAVGLLVVALWVTAVRRPERRSAGWVSVVLGLVAVFPARIFVGLAAQGGQSPRDEGILTWWVTVIVLGLALLPLLVVWIWPYRPRRPTVPAPQLLGDRPGGVRPGPDRRDPPPPPPGPSGWL